LRKFQFALSSNECHIAFVPERDASQKALEQVQKITDSEPVNGEDLLESPELKELLRDAKERLKSESGEPLSE
jgi:hypothetical protein